MLRARRTIPITGLLILLASLARAGQETWTGSGPAPHVVALAADVAEDGVVYAADGTTVYLSTNGGASWAVAASGLDGISVLVADPGRASSLFAGTNHGVLHSTDRGAHFAATGLRTAVRSLAIDATGRVLVSSDGVRGSPPRRSADGGATWSPAVGPRTAGRVAALLFNPAPPGVAFAGLEGDMSYYPAIIAGSSDGGATWRTMVSYGGSGIHALASSPGGQTLYAAFSGFGQGVGVSRDRGRDFVSASSLLDAYVSSLAVDPVSGRAYAGTDVGVFYSDNAGRDWIAINDGLTDLRVAALAVEPTTGRLHAATPTGVFDFDPAPPPPPTGPCVADEKRLCLLGGRFRLTLTARNPRTGVVGPGAANPQGDRFGFFALPEFTGDAAFPEVLVKMVDETALPGHSFWFFYSGLTSLPYELEVEDTTTGERRTYRNAPDNPFCGGADTSLFPAGGPETESLAKASLLPAGDGASLFLLDRRFEVTLTASDPARNRSSAGAAIPWGDRAGYFSLPDFTGDPAFPEVFVKMVDYTSISGEYWFFFTGLTHLPYTLTVTDHATGLSRQYDATGAFCGAADTAAFSASGTPDLRGSWTGTVTVPTTP